MDFSWPLPQTITVSPFLANLLIAKLMASCLSGMRKKYLFFLWRLLPPKFLFFSCIPAFRQPLAIWAIIFLTSSVLGSSAVRTAKSAALAASSPIMGLFNLSLKPAVPKTTISLFLVWVLAKDRASFKALILWAKSMITFMPCPFLTLSILPGTPLNVLRAFSAVFKSTPASLAAATAASIFAFWNAGSDSGRSTDLGV